jgi:hypothetical protein
MASIRSGWKSKFVLSAVSALIVVVILGAGEIYCRYFTRINFLDNSRGMFVYKQFGNSYALRPKYNGVSFGEEFMTDDDGFRLDPPSKYPSQTDENAILIMGDSVAFGPALTDDVTIAGHLRKKMPAINVYNGAAIGYDSFDYKTVTLARIEQHPRIKTVLLFLCLNDISDSSAQVIRSQNGQTTEEQSDPQSRSLIRRVNDYLRSRSKLYLWLKNALVDTQMYYFKYDLAGYQKGETNVADSLRPIVELNRELTEKGVALKVFVSPYEAQLRQPAPEGHDLPQKTIGKILTDNEVENYDLAPEFLRAAPDKKGLYLYGDPMHLSAAGATIAANVACAHTEGCTPQ